MSTKLRSRQVFKFFHFLSRIFHIDHLLKPQNFKNHQERIVLLHKIQLKMLSITYPSFKFSILSSPYPSMCHKKHSTSHAITYELKWDMCCLSHIPSNILMRCNGSKPSKYPHSDLRYQSCKQKFQEQTLLDINDFVILKIWIMTKNPRIIFTNDYQRFLHILTGFVTYSNFWFKNLHCCQSSM